MLEWFVDDVVDDLGTRKEIDYAFRIMDEGSSADRQIAVFQKTGDLRDVVDHLIAESAEGVPEFQPAAARA
jgi:carboxylate-amine ligase